MSTSLRPARLLGIGALAATTTMLLAGCGVFLPTERFSDSETFDAEVHTIEIDEPSGGVTVRGDADATNLEVTRTVSYRGSREVGTTYELLDGVLVLEGCGRFCWVEYTIDVPLGVDVRGTTANGDIELRGVADVDVETSNGRVELVDVTGTVDAQTSNGRIEGRGLAGSGVRAATSNGSIELRLQTAQDVEVRTSNGGITLEVPTDDVTYRVRTETSNGSVDVEIDEDDDGEFDLDLSTSNGSIDIRRA